MTTITYRAPLRVRLRTGRNTAARHVADRPELIGLVAIAGVLNLWGLAINGWANTYYSAAVRSMTESWHNFLFASLDRSGLMTVDKPPLSLWVQALSARVFGFHPLSLLIPQALMGMAAAALLYDLTRRRFGRPAGFAAGLALATTPMIVAVSRHNNPDELLVLCTVAAVWCMARALESGRTKWLVLCGVCVGLGFETKMLVALMVVPGIAAAYLWVAPRGRSRALRQLLAGGAALVAVGGAWPLLVTLTPAGDRPWISGTSDNTIWSLIFGYNGLGRVAGQSGGPGGGAGGGGTFFGGPTGLFRLLQSGLGDQAGWLLGFALVSGLALVAITRLRRRDPRTGWVIVLGGGFLTTAVVFSFARGIFHPYYVSLLAPFTAALVGAGIALILARDRVARVAGPAAVLAGVVVELVVLGELNGALSWARPLLIVAGVAAAALALNLSRSHRAAVVTVAIAALLAAPAAWAAETLGHATSGTFPAGGSATASQPGFGGGARGFGGARPRLAPPPGAGFAPPPIARGGGFGPPPTAGGGFPGGARSAAGFGADSATLEAAISYAKAHGGGTIGVSSQSSAAAAILSDNANVAGLGGFSGRESSVSVNWLAVEVRTGHLRWVLANDGQGLRLPGDTRTGSHSAITAVERACRAVTVKSSGGATLTLYDCAGRASAIVRAAEG